jgi:hypothetical protein
VRLERGEDIGFADGLEGGEEVDVVGLRERFEGLVDEGFDGLWEKRTRERGVYVRWYSVGGRTADVGVETRLVTLYTIALFAESIALSSNAIYVITAANQLSVIVP